MSYCLLVRVLTLRVEVGTVRCQFSEKIYMLPSHAHGGYLSREFRGYLSISRQRVGLLESPSNIIFLSLKCVKQTFNLFLDGADI